MNQEQIQYPSVGRIYHMFDDGKITFMRHSLVRCKAIIPFAEFINHPMYNTWKECITDIDWVFSKTTPHIIVCEYLDPVEDDGVPNELFYSLTQDNGWYGFGAWLDNGTLDVSGKLWDELYAAIIEGNGALDYTKGEVAEIIEDNNKVANQ